MSVQIQNSILLGSLYASFPVVGIIGAGYLEQSPLVGAAAALVGEYLYLGNESTLYGGVAAAIGAIYLPQYLSFLPGGVLGTVLGGVLAGSAYAMVDSNLMTPGRTGIIAPTK
jgi:hypothetical protein